MKEDFIPVKITAIVSGIVTPMILLVSEEKKKYLMINIRRLEVKTIDDLLIKRQFDRPMTIDQLVNTLQEIAQLKNFQYTGVAITEFRDNKYYAVLETSEGRQIDYRPSDAMAVAIKMGLPIFVADDLLLHNSEEFIENLKKAETAVPASEAIH